LDISMLGAKVLSSFGLRRMNSHLSDDFACGFDDTSESTL
jgi:hypothetical protein